MLLYFQHTVFIPYGEVSYIQLTNALRHVNSELSNKAVLVTATNNIAIYVMNREPRNHEGYTAYPVAVMGTEYWVHTYTSRSFFMIVGLEPDTHISVEFPTVGFVQYNGVYYAVWQALTMTIHRYLTVHLGDFSGQLNDLTGAHIVSDKPIALWAGNMDTPIGHNGGMDMIIEMHIPVEAWGTQFVLVSTPLRRSGDIFCAMTATANTGAQLSTGGSIVLNAAGLYFDFRLNSNSRHLLSTTESVFVVLYSLSYVNGGDPPEGGDPFMITLFPAEDYTNTEYIMVTVDLFPSGEFVHTLLFTVDDTVDPGRLLHNGAQVGTPPVGWSPIPGTTMMTTWIYVNPGVHRISHPDRDIVFYAMLTGIAPDTSYALVAGSAVSKI